jgi:hypothetical protein
MRRILSILMALVLGLGPALAAVPAEALALRSGWSGWTGQADESHLPACCRRHGAHHCSMGAAEGSSRASEGTSLAAPSTCPCAPASLASIATVAVAMPAGPPNALPFPEERRALPGSVVEASASGLHRQPQRGPPSVTNTTSL